MPGMEHLWLYTLLVFGIILLPGMDMAFVLASSLADGRRAGLAAVAGMVVGGFVHVHASGLGLAWLLQTHAPLFNVMLLAGGLYMGWLGAQLWRGAGALSTVEAADRRPLRATFMRAVLTCLLNPKAYLFCLAVLPQFIRPGRMPMRAQVFVLFLIGALAQVLVYGSMTLAAAQVRERLAASASAQRGMGRALGMLLMALAAWTLIAGWR